MISDLFPREADGVPFMPSSCARCGALINIHMRDRHIRWHAAVDTAATTLSPSDTKGLS